MSRLLELKGMELVLEMELALVLEMELALALALALGLGSLLLGTSEPMQDMS